MQALLYCSMASIRTKKHGANSRDRAIAIRSRRSCGVYKVRTTESLMNCNFFLSLSESPEVSSPVSCVLLIGLGKQNQKTRRATQQTFSSQPKTLTYVNVYFMCAKRRSAPLIMRACVSVCLARSLAAM